MEEKIMKEFNLQTIIGETILLEETQAYKNMGFDFGEDHEISMTATFRNGYAVLDNFKYYKMVYPTMEDVKASTSMQDAITAYTCRDEINFFDIALKYGKLVIDYDYLKDSIDLYAPSTEVIALVLKMATMLDRFQTNVTMNKKIGNLVCVKVERENSNAMVLVHWKPMPKLSTKKDPFCSAFILTKRELQTIIREFPVTMKPR